jgi:hypothetical protein
MLTGGTGKWKETITPYQAEYYFKTDAVGTITYTIGGQPPPFDIAYSVFDDVGVDYDKYGENWPYDNLWKRCNVLAKLD